jgi:hypothetical protein
MYGVTERFVIPDDLAQAAAREGRDGWLAGLPALVARIAADWRIEVGAPFLPGRESLGRPRPRRRGQRPRAQGRLATPGGRA